MPFVVQTCHGSGVQVMMRPLGPGMMQQIQQPCARCNQTGYSTPAHDTCTDCSGKVQPSPCWNWLAILVLDPKTGYAYVLTSSRDVKRDDVLSEAHNEALGCTSVSVR